MSLWRNGGSDPVSRAATSPPDIGRAHTDSMPCSQLVLLFVRFWYKIESLRACKTKMTGTGVPGTLVVKATCRSPRTGAMYLKCQQRSSVMTIRQFTGEYGPIARFEKSELRMVTMKRLPADWERMMDTSWLRGHGGGDITLLATLTGQRGRLAGGRVHIRVIRRELLTSGLLQLMDRSSTFWPVMVSKAGYALQY